MNRNIKKLTIILTISLILSFLTEAYLLILTNNEILSSIQFDLIFNMSIKKILALFIIFTIILHILINKNLREKYSNYLYKYRYLIGLSIIIICIIFELHGSSIGYWKTIFTGENYRPLIGVTRIIRSDEYLVSTPLAFSQYYNDFNYFSTIIRATPTDMFLLYGQAVKDICIIFHPFNIGYLFLNQAKGLSFFWIGRFVCLFLVSFEMGMILTKSTISKYKGKLDKVQGDKLLSLSYGILITFAPIVQWWFAINGLVEQLIFGQLGIILVYNYMRTNNYKKRLIFALSLVVCIGTYMFSLYPAWQISLAYVFLFLLIWLIIDNYKDFIYSYKDMLLIIISIIILSILTCHILSRSLPFGELLLNTVYPGSRSTISSLNPTNQGLTYYIFNYISSIFYPLNLDFAVNNPCEIASFYDFFPVPIILYIITNFIEKHKDKLLNLLMIPFLILFLYFTIGIPSVINKILLLNHINGVRILVALGFLNIIILIRSISLLKGDFKNKLLNKLNKNNYALIIISLLISISVYWFSLQTFDNYNNLYSVILIMILILTSSIFFIFKANTKKGKIGFLLCCIIIGFMGGAFVNPIDSGADSYLNEDVVNYVGETVKNNPNSTWLMEGNVYGDSFIQVGAHTINSINMYPNLDKWNLIDPEGKYIEEYNRYAHITILLNNQNNTNFNSNYPDQFTLNLDVDNLEKLNISYIVSSNDLNNLSTEHTQFNKVYNDLNHHYNIYKINYN